jgi:hypothetical protein
MRFRKNCFAVLSALIFLAACLWLASYAVVVSDDEIATENEIDQDAAAVGGVMLTLCIAAPAFILSSLLGWRNAVGLRTERRHQEALAAQFGEIDSTVRNGGFQPGEPMSPREYERLQETRRQQRR